MKNLIVLMLVLAAVASTESLLYWGNGDDGPSPYPWHGVKFEFVDFPGWEGMTIHELELDIINADSTLWEYLRVRVFIFDGEESLPDAEIPLDSLASLALYSSYISPISGLNAYPLLSSVDVGQCDGTFWVLVYTPSVGYNGTNKLAWDRTIYSGHTYASSPAGHWNGAPMMGVCYEAHVTVSGYMWTSALEPATWGTIKAGF